MSDIQAQLKEHLEKKNYDDIWIIGGEKLYNYFLNTKEVKKIYLTTIDRYYTCDVFFLLIQHFMDFN